MYMVKLHDKYAKGKERNGELLSYLVTPLGKCGSLRGVCTRELEGGVVVEVDDPDEEGVDEWIC
jgi:hypothetical protein